MGRLVHLIDNSAATTDLGDAELAALLDRARTRNASMGVTGMLLHVDQSFFQVLEGPEEAVTELAAIIARDPRHDRMTTIIREPVARRSFGEWTMGFSRGEHGATAGLDGVNDFFDAGRVLADLDPGRARKLLSAFRDGRWRVQPDGPR